MKKSRKIILFLASLAGLGFSVCVFSMFYPVSYVSEAVWDWQALYPWLRVVLTGYVACICLVFLLLMLAAVFSPNASNDMVIMKGKGSLRFSRQAIESTVRYSFSDVDGISFSRVRVKLGNKPEKAKIFVKISLNNPATLAELAETVQNKIEAALKTALGVDIKSINVRVVESGASAVPKKTGGGEEKETESRVL